MSPISLTLAQPLKKLLLAAELGLNRNHPLAGWNLLMILYRDSPNSGVPSTLDFLARKYNNDYLDTDNDEAPISDEVLRKVLNVLTEQAGLVEANTRKVRRHTESGKSLIQQTAIYRITSSGIEYLRMMQKVVDAESTVTANTLRINEFCALVRKLAQEPNSAATTQLYNDFANMLAAYEDVMKGMHKLDEDLDELANDLAFNHGGVAAEQLQQMLQQKAVPAYRQLLQQASYIKGLANLRDFAAQVARSQQGSDDLDTANAVGDQAGLLQRFNRTKAYVQRQLKQMALSFTASSQAIDSSLDSIYLLFQTILNAIKLLSQEFEHVRRQTLDIKELTGELDELLQHYSTLKVPDAVPRHAPFDRIDVENMADLLEATTIGPVTYVAQEKVTPVLTAADNPAMAAVTAVTNEGPAALAEFQQLVLRAPQHAVIDHDLELTTLLARDEIVRLFSATGYTHYASFAPFGRAVQRVAALPKSGPIRIHCRGEQYSVFLPHGFEVWFT
ncbi:hypothetical protein [Loigolactobacillus coryniformis]|uniref:Uncharacterized protein n=1 Tax=Loigolactobacillus coryniformis subsp. coryniformis KCTC 3167 = DSM 20001 TaxID=913848 RepID=A0A0R1F5X8_9LACO|nr:hypothetical protein [Loigolactobacillus coryniformis]ATO56299.1 hypothetical protein LC20001_12005 [Loigolactobacillus coryniformis subsp. coryniformis KCTC 3167 = DSM 20001]KRK14532.1 hypothetical protein FD22_GL002311 [Loigolactobacillus coryniformis subsp. coryniformis KCTC 3167 = DSM 20001]